MDIVDNIVDEILKCCLDKLGEDEWFLSEDDFKFSFAQAATEKGAKNVILEYPIMTSELYKKKPEVKETFIQYYDAHNGNTRRNTRRTAEERYNENRSFIDVYFEYNDVKHFIELKYKTNETEVFRHSQSFILKAQGAQDNGMYDIHEDIERMEAIMSSIDCNGHVIALTNDPNYLKKPRDNTQKSRVSLYEHSQSNTIDYSDRRKLIIQNSYRTWNQNNQGIRGSQFHKLVIHANDPESIYQEQQCVTVC